MGSSARIFQALSILIGVTALGTAGFVYVEGMAWVDAFYLTVVTVSTVGYGDFVPLTPAGRIFAAALIITGVGITLYLISVIARLVFEGQLSEFFLKSSMNRRVEGMNGHVIVCGYGRFGRVVCEELRSEGKEVLVVEIDPALEDELIAAEVPYLIGTAASDEILERAGIRKASSVVVATSGEAGGVFVTLSARELNSNLTIHARGETSAAIRRLKRSGADFVHSPYQAGGLRTAACILRPSVVDFLELSSPHHSEEIDLEEVAVGEGSRLVGTAISVLEDVDSKLKVVALKQRGRAIELAPGRAQVIEAGDHLVVIGEKSELAVLAQDALSR